MEFLADYGLFLLKTATIVFAMAIVLGLAASSKKSTKKQMGQIEINDLNESFKDLEDTMINAICSEASLKAKAKADKKAAKKAEKEAKKASKEATAEAAVKPRRFVIDFDGDMKVSNINELQEMVTTVLTAATQQDEVVVKLESPGGIVHAYGLAAAQLKRIVDKSIPLTVCVDQVAASGGYMMACVADKIIASPFALVGSIGVVAQVPNIHRLLKKHDVDVELHTAGKYKRTLTMLGENTQEGREKFKEDLENIHVMFRDMVAQNRPDMDIDQVATGEVWYGSKALEKGLVDEISTSDEYLFAGREAYDQYEVAYVTKKSMGDRFGLAVSSAIELSVEKLVKIAQRPSF